ncbi:hypothetical protein ACFLIM_05090 [Nonomuraea sp. M3C6]|uniref:HEPN domain-containing protein n=1 Tax=Nonomuraea marmarensis TaxID=3351344 RepID=A0ABW7A5E3_9ACTN
MRRDFNADDYLHLASALTGEAWGRRTVFLRRAISTAYYALFYELVQHGARRAARTGPLEHQQVIGRWYAHGNFRKAARWVDDLVARRTLPGPVSLLFVDSTTGTVPADLEELAKTFSELQVLRHRADYDPAFQVTREEALIHVWTAKTGIEAIRRMDKANLHQFDMFLLLALGGERMIKNS